MWHDMPVMDYQYNMEIYFQEVWSICFEVDWTLHISFNTICWKLILSITHIRLKSAQIIMSIYSKWSTLKSIYQLSSTMS